MTTGSAHGYRAADHNNYGVNNDKGMVDFSVEFAPPGSPGGPISRPGVGQLAHQRLREAGIGWVRYWLSWQTVEYEDNAFQWEQPALEEFRHAGRAALRQEGETLEFLE